MRAWCCGGRSACVSDGEGAVASTESSRASRKSAGVTTAASDTWRQRMW
jgi:hypothetical protein